MRPPTGDRSLRQRCAVKALIVANGFLEAQFDDLRRRASTGYAWGGAWEHATEE